MIQTVLFSNIHGEVFLNPQISMINIEYEGHFLIKTSNFSRFNDKYDAEDR